jgi:biotin transport system substrate-specific component
MTESGQYESVELVGDRTVQYFAFAVAVAVLTAAFAQVSVPLGPVPFTLQTAGVFLAGLLLGPAWGGLALVLYLLVGIAGAPVFSSGSAGLGVVTGPTGGFLVSFPVAAAIIGGIVHRRVEPRSPDDINLGLAILALLVGMGIVYAIGVPWFAQVQDVSLAKANSLAGLKFVPGDLLKAGAVLALLRGGHLALVGTFDE